MPANYGILGSHGASVKPEELKVGQVLHVLHPYHRSRSRPGMYLHVESVGEASVQGYRVLRNGEEGYRTHSYRTMTIAFEHILRIIKQPEG